MHEYDDKDDGVEHDAPLLQDVADDILKVVKPEALTKEELVSYGVVQILNSNLAEARRRIKKLEAREDDYHQLRVDNARLHERVCLNRKSSIFWDLILVLAPLFIGMCVNRENIFRFDGAVVWFPLLLFIVAALLSRYGFSRSSDTVEGKGAGK